MIGYLLYNPAAACGQCQTHIQTLPQLLDGEIRLFDITHITNYAAFFRNLTPDDYLILAGGDGTLNRFINDTAGLKLPERILYYPAGSGNDFAHDLGYQPEDPPFLITPYLRALPHVLVNGKNRYFLNGVGYGIDGYCCEIGDIQRKKKRKHVNYTAIAIQGLLFHYRPTRATVTVDGVVHHYQRVWLAPTMNGRFYGGGMMPTPSQSRTAAVPQLSTMVFHDSGKLRTLAIFPSIFKGTHIQHRCVEVLTGQQITVEFDRPTALQIDGETISGVTGYCATAAPAPSDVSTSLPFSVSTSSHI